MKLTDLDPQFLHIDDSSHYAHVAHVEDADGVSFLCPKCFVANGGPVRTHQILCWRPRVSQDISPTPGRWEFEGTGYHDLTLVAGSSSILLSNPDGCGAHFFIRRGDVVMA